MNKKFVRHQGFTLIEVMIVVAIIGILAAIAYPSYQESVAKSRRADARAQLVDAANYMQRFYSQNDRYDQTNAATPVATTLPAALAVAPKGASAGTQNYDISFVASTLTATAYTLQAVPRAGGPMANDRCGSLALSSVGRRTTINATSAGTMAVCWP